MSGWSCTTLLLVEGVRVKVDAAENGAPVLLFTATIHTSKGRCGRGGSASAFSTGKIHKLTATIQK